MSVSKHRKYHLSLYITLSQNWKNKRECGKPFPRGSRQQYKTNTTPTVLVVARNMVIHNDSDIVHSPEVSHADALKTAGWVSAVVLHPLNDAEMNPPLETLRQKLVNKRQQSALEVI